MPRIHAPHYEYWIHKGHTFGQCLHGPVGSSGYSNYIPIPKCGSTWVNIVLFHSLNWQVGNIYTDPGLGEPGGLGLSHNRNLVVLREPIERWLSGIAEYSYRYHDRDFINNLNKQTLDLIFDRVALDDHTEKQVYYCHGLHRYRSLFFRCDSTLIELFTQFLTSNGVDIDTSKIPPANVTATDQYKLSIKETFRNIIENDIKYKNKLIDYFKADFDLIDSINFYPLDNENR
jgi:hypothetical protein